MFSRISGYGRNLVQTPKKETAQTMSGISRHSVCRCPPGAKQKGKKNAQVLSSQALSLVAETSRKQKKKKKLHRPCSADPGLVSAILVFLVFLVLSRFLPDIVSAVLVFLVFLVSSRFCRFVALLFEEARSTFPTIMKRVRNPNAGPMTTLSEKVSSGWPGFIGPYYGGEINSEHDSILYIFLLCIHIISHSYFYILYKAHFRHSNAIAPSPSWQPSASLEAYRHTD